MSESRGLFPGVVGAADDRVYTNPRYGRAGPGWWSSSIWGASRLPALVAAGEQSNSMVCACSRSGCISTPWGVCSTRLRGYLHASVACPGGRSGAGSAGGRGPPHRGSQGGRVHARASRHRNAVQPHPRGKTVAAARSRRAVVTALGPAVDTRWAGRRARERIVSATVASRQGLRKCRPASRMLLVLSNCIGRMAVSRVLPCAVGA